MSLRIEVDQERLAEFCRRHHIKTLAFFGSVLRDDFRPDSDVDVLVEYEPGTRVRIGDILDQEEELVRMFGRPVDLIERRAVEQARNPVRKRHILQTAEVAYAG